MVEKGSFSIKLLINWGEKLKLVLNLMITAPYFLLLFLLNMFVFFFFADEPGLWGIRRFKADEAFVFG